MSNSDRGGRGGGNTIERVAEPAPALASTTSVPASWMRLVIAAAAASSKVTLGVACRTEQTADQHKQDCYRAGWYVKYLHNEWSMTH